VVEWSDDVSAADWIVDRLHHLPTDVAWEVRSFVPDTFEAYTRLLHPPRRVASGRRVKERWGDVAHERNVRLGPATPFEELATGTSGATEEPLAGTLDPDELRALVDLLAGATRTPGSCWFGLWEGYGWMQGHPAFAELTSDSSRGSIAGRSSSAGLDPGKGLRDQDCRLSLPAPEGRVRVSDRSLVLYRGAIGAATAFCHPPACQSPNLWWPEDRGWCVVSEIDFHSTYLGGAEALIHQVLHDARFEAIPVRPTDSVTD